LAHHVFLGFAQIGRRLIGAHHLDHVADLEHGLHVGGLKCALPHIDVGGRGRGLRGGIEIAALLDQEGTVGKVHQLQLGELVSDAVDHARYRAVGRDADVAVIGRDGDGAAVTLHLIALAGHQIAVGVEGEVAVTGVAHAGRGLNREIACAPYGHIISGAGLLDIALIGVAHHAGVFYEADRLQPFLALGRTHHGDKFLELRGFTLEAWGRDVGDIVRDHVHRPVRGELMRKTNEK